MQRGSNSKDSAQKGKRGKRIIGICAAAETLGVHRNHLRLVLRGQRVSHSLLRRYQALQEAQP